MFHEWVYEMKSEHWQAVERGNNSCGGGDTIDCKVRVGGLPVSTPPGAPSGPFCYLTTRKRKSKIHFIAHRLLDIY